MIYKYRYFSEKRTLPKEQRNTHTENFMRIRAHDKFTHTCLNDRARGIIFGAPYELLYDFL